MRSWSGLRALINCLFQEYFSAISEMAACVFLGIFVCPSLCLFFGDVLGNFLVLIGVVERSGRCAVFW